MNQLSVALLQSDAKNIRLLASSLCHHFPAIYTAWSIADLREKIVKHRAQLVIVDMEMASLSDVHLLHRDFTNVSIVCTHRLADDEMWTAALNAGASDVCPSFDTRGIVTAAIQSTALTDSAAA